MLNCTVRGTFCGITFFQVSADKQTSIWEPKPSNWLFPLQYDDHETVSLRMRPLAVLYKWQRAHLNAELLRFDIVDKKGETLLPRRVFGSVNHLWKTDNGRQAHVGSFFTRRSMLEQPPEKKIQKQGGLTTLLFLTSSPIASSTKEFGVAFLFVN